MAATRFIHNFDLIYCEMGANNHKGADPTFKVPDDEVDAEGKHLVDYRIVTVDDLMRVTLFGCSGVPAGRATRVASILEGQAKEILIRGKIPLLVSLVALEADTGHVIRVAINYAERMAGHEGAKKHVYLDTAVPPRKTVGIGFNMDKTGAKDEFDTLMGSGGTRLFDEVRNGTTSLSQSQMIKLLEDGKPGFESSARSTFSSFDTLTPERQATLMEIEANMGATSVSKFKKMIAAVDGGDYKQAAYELLHSSSGGPSDYVGQVKEGRANNIAGALRWSIVGSPAAPLPVDSAPGSSDPSEQP